MSSINKTWGKCVRSSWTIIDLVLSNSQTITVPFYLFSFLAEKYWIKMNSEFRETFFFCSEDNRINIPQLNFTFYSRSFLPVPTNWVKRSSMKAKQFVVKLSWHFCVSFCFSEKNGSNLTVWPNICKLRGQKKTKNTKTGLKIREMTF